MEESVGRRIRALRERAGLTQEDLAERMEVSRQAVSKWEANLSRPSAENLIRLAKLLDVDLAELIGTPQSREPRPPEQAVPQEQTEQSAPQAQAEQAETAGPTQTAPEAAPVSLTTEAAPQAPCPPEKRANQAAQAAPPQKRAHRRLTKVLAAAAVLVLAVLALNLAAGGRRPSAKNAPPADQGTPAQETPAGSGAAQSQALSTLPDTLSLAPSAYYDLEAYTNYGDSVDPLTVEDGLLFQYRFPSTAATIVFYRVPSTESGTGGETLYHLCAAYTLGDGQYTVMARIAEDRADGGAPRLMAWEALGWRGCKVLTEDEFGTDTFFFALPEGVPRLLYMTTGETVEWDLDGDGENELVFLDHPENILFLDRGMEEYTAYCLADPLPEGAELTVENGAFVLRRGEEVRHFRHVWADTLTEDAPAGSGYLLRREEVDEVKDAVIIFLSGQFSDGLDPDAPYGGAGSGLPTHRQLAYMGLQSLYDLTGQTVQRCYAVATHYGVCLALDKNLDHHSFLDIQRTEEWYRRGGKPDSSRVVGGISLTWQDENAPWSPLVMPDRAEGVPLTERAQRVYDALALFQTGPIATVSAGAIPTDVRLHLANGDFYEVSFDGPQGLFDSLRGVYPAGFEH